MKTKVIADADPSSGHVYAENPLGRRSLSHIPGDRGLPLIGNALAIWTTDSLVWARQRVDRYGLVSRTNFFGTDLIALVGAAANDFVLFDNSKLFSSRMGWAPFLGRLTPNGLMLMDFDEHKLHRRALATAFKTSALQSYVSLLDREIAALVAKWRAAPGPISFYKVIRNLAFDLAGAAFFASTINAEETGLPSDFEALVKGITSIIRVPLPGTTMGRAVSARKRIEAYLAKQVAITRERGGDDLFSQLCQATTDGGGFLSVQAVVDHMCFFLLAAHGTMASALTAFVWQLALNQDWQDRLREEMNQLGLGPDEPTPFHQLPCLELTDMAFNEALRMVPPIARIFRRCVREFEFAGYRIPANSAILLDVHMTHHLPDVWPEPDHFDPTRFRKEEQAGRPRGAFMPFSGGAHTCLGLAFAHMQAKCFARHLLQSLKVKTTGSNMAWQMTPMAEPKHELTLLLSRC